MSVDRNTRLLVTGHLGHAVDLSVGELLDFVLAEIRKELAREQRQDADVRPT
jgi:hypothetical protein